MSTKPEIRARGSVSLDLELVEAGIAGTEFAGKVHHFPSVSSTNTMALEAAQLGVRSGVWVADEQTAGRGRGGHQWHSVRSSLDSMSAEYYGQDQNQ